MTFYESLRDSTAGPLISQYGTSMTLVKPATQSYDPSTGANTVTDDGGTAVKGLIISLALMLKRGAGGKHQFSDEMVKQWDHGVVLSAKECAVAGVEPSVNDTLTINGRPTRIAWIEPIEPGGVPVIYRLAVAEY